MTRADKTLVYLYVNGLGDGSTTLKDHLVCWWWRLSGRSIVHNHINWYDGQGLHQKEQQVADRVLELLKTFDGVAMIGSSAGGSLALNVFSALKHKNICVVTAHARVRVGDYPDSNGMSLYRRARLDTNHPLQAFSDSVTVVEKSTIPSFSPADKERILSLTQLIDLVVDVCLMQITGVQTHRSLAFGHSGGFVAHLLADRDLIARFAERQIRK